MKTVLGVIEGFIAGLLVAALMFGPAILAAWL